MCFYKQKRWPEGSPANRLTTWCRRRGPGRRRFRGLRQPGARDRRVLRGPPGRLRLPDYSPRPAGPGPVQPGDPPPRLDHRARRRRTRAGPGPLAQPRRRPPRGGGPRPVPGPPARPRGPRAGLRLRPRPPRARRLHPALGRLSAGAPNGPRRRRLRGRRRPVGAMVRPHDLREGGPIRLGPPCFSMPGRVRWRWIALQPRPTPKGWHDCRKRSQAKTVKPRRGEIVPRREEEPGHATPSGFPSIACLACHNNSILSGFARSVSSASISTQIPHDAGHWVGKQLVTATGSGWA